jgi:RimJ/RimL family protein N-acetyltransferase
MMVTEYPVEYPAMDEEELDNFVVHVARQLNDNPHFAGWVAIRGRKVIGFTIVEICERAIGKPHRFAMGHWIYIVPKHRDKHISRELQLATVQWLMQNNIDKLEFFANEGDDQWVRRGNRPLGHRYVADLSDALRVVSAIPKLQAVGGSS